LGEIRLGEMGLGEMGQNQMQRSTVDKKNLLGPCGTECSAVSQEMRWLFVLSSGNVVIPLFQETVRRLVSCD